MELVTAKLQFFMEFAVLENIHTLPKEGKGSSQGRWFQRRRFPRGMGVAFPSLFSTVSKQELLFSLMIFDLCIKISCHRLKNKLPPIYLLLIMVLLLWYSPWCGVVLSLLLYHVLTERSSLGVYFECITDSFTVGISRVVLVVLQNKEGIRLHGPPALAYR